jgi:hypothetical protein
LRDPAWKEAKAFMGVMIMSVKELDEKMASVFGFR